MQSQRAGFRFSLILSHFTPLLFKKQRGRQDLTIIHPTQNVLKTRIQGFRMAVEDFTSAEDVVTNR